MHCNWILLNEINKLNSSKANEMWRVVLFILQFRNLAKGNHVAVGMHKNVSVFRRLINSSFRRFVHRLTLVTSNNSIKDSADPIDDPLLFFVFSFYFDFLFQFDLVWAKGYKCKTISYVNKILFLSFSLHFGRLFPVTKTMK